MYSVRSAPTAMLWFDRLFFILIACNLLTIFASLPQLEAQTAHEGGAVGDADLALAVVAQTRGLQDAGQQRIVDAREVVLGLEHREGREDQQGERLVDGRRGGFVAGFDRLVDVLHCRAELGAQAGIVLTLRFALPGALSG